MNWKHLGNIIKDGVKRKNIYLCLKILIHEVGVSRIDTVQGVFNGVVERILVVTRKIQNEGLEKNKRD